MSRRVLLIGAGGLGTPAALALAHAGLRELTILDPDRVDLTNLHRQVLYTERDVGHPKASALAAALRGKFPKLEVEAIEGAFRAGGAPDLLPRFDAVIDGTDRFETKLAVSDACVDLGVPFVFGGVVGFDAQVLAVRPGESACVRCLFDDAPPPGAAATCADLGILGPVAGLAGAKQADAALALLDGRRDVLDALWIYDGLRDRERNVALRRAPDCKGCGARRAERAHLDAPLPAEGPSAPELDLTALVCPGTYLAARRALEPMAPGERIWVLLSSDESARNVPASAVASGHKVLASSSDGRVHRVLLERGTP